MRAFRTSEYPLHLLAAAALGIALWICHVTTASDDPASNETAVSAVAAPDSPPFVIAITAPTPPPVPPTPVEHDELMQ
jgi:hypothetical protein